MSDELRSAVHDAIIRALDEACVREPVLRGMAIEVGLERFADVLAAPQTGAPFDSRQVRGILKDAAKPSDQQGASTDHAYNCGTEAAIVRDCDCHLSRASKDQQGASLEGIDAAFARAMEGKRYGEQETANAKWWFVDGYKAALASQDGAKK